MLSCLSLGFMLRNWSAGINILITLADFKTCQNIPFVGNKEHSIAPLSTPSLEMHSLLFIGYLGSLLGIEWPEHEADHCI